MLRKTVSLLLIVLLIGCASQETIKGKGFERIGGSISRTLIYPGRFPDGRDLICEEKREIVPNIKGNGNLELNTIADVSGSYEKKFNRIRETAPTRIEFEAALFLACDNFGKGVISLEKYKEIVSKITDCHLNWLETISGITPKDVKPKKRGAHIEFRDESPFVDGQLVGIVNSTKRWTVYYYKVRIINDSDEPALKVRNLKISDLEILEGGRFKRWDLAKKPFSVDWDPTVSKTIPPGGEVLAWLLRVYPPDLQQILDSKLWTGPHNIPQLRFISFRDEGRMTIEMASKVHEGVYRFTLTAYFENAPPATAKFELVCPPEKGRTTAKALVENIKIKMLKPEE